MSRHVFKGAPIIMKHSLVLRVAAEAVFVLIGIAAAFGPAFAQSPVYGSIGLYADESRSSNTASFAGAYTEITMYVFCNPTARGLAGVEFSVAYPANVLPADVTTNPLISVSLGELDTGISVAFTDCQDDWVWTHQQRLFLMSADETRVGIEKNAAAGDYQSVTCELGYPIEPLFISSLLCLNAACPPDTAAPLIQGANPSWPSTVTVAFSEQVLKQSAQNPSSYVIAELDDSSATASVGEAVLLSDGASVALYASQPFTPGVRYAVRAPGVYDLWGNAVPYWSTAAFSTADHDPPRLLSASSPADSQLIAVFNEAVAPATATNPNNYRIYNYGTLVPSYPYRAVLSDAKRVTLSFNNLNLLPTLAMLTLKATNVTDLAGNVISPTYSQASFISPDTRPPFVVLVAVLGKRLVSVRFNEELSTVSAQLATNYEIYRNDAPSSVTVTAAVLQSDRRFVQLSLGGDLLLETTYVLRTHNIEDRHGNRMSEPANDEFLWPDTLAPALLAAMPLDRTLVRVWFDEKLDKTTAETKTNYRMYETAHTAISIPISGAELEAGADAVRLSLGSPMKLDVGYTIRVQNVKDLKGNAISTATITTIYPDTFPPVMTAVTPTSATTVELAFDEALTRNSAENESNYLLFETANPSHTVGIAAAMLMSDSSEVGLALAADLVAGTSYTISVSNLMDRSENVIPPGTSLGFTFADAIPPALLSAYASTSTAVLAIFDEKVDNVTAQNPANYLVYETAAPGATISVSSAALQSDSSNVLLTLGGTLRAGIAYSLKATGVTDRAGNSVPAGSVVPIGRPDTTPPHLSGAEATTLSYVRVVFDEAVLPATAFVTANYTIVPVSFAGSSIHPVSVDLPDGKTAGLHLGANLAEGATYKVSVSNVTDLAGNPIAPGSEKSFSTPYGPPGGTGFIGLYSDEFHSSNMANPTAPYTVFPMWVWCLPGDNGMIAAEFSVAFPGNVIPMTMTMNPLVVVSLGTITTDLSLAFGQCYTGWTWAVRQECFVLNLNQSVVRINPTALFANCTEGYPIETGTIISDLSCNGGGGLATLLQESAASYRNGAVEVTWRLSRMDNGVRFTVLRKEEGDAAYGSASDDIEGNGLSFAYRDRSAEPGTAYRYRVEYANASGSHALFETDPVAVPALPLTLNQNWPNPFNPSTTISYYLPGAIRVRLEIFDVAGRRIACLVNGNEERGNRSAVWNGASESGKPAAAGIYIYRLTAGRETLSRKMVLVR